MHVHNTFQFPSFHSLAVIPLTFTASDSFIYLKRTYEVNYNTYRLKTRLIGQITHKTCKMITLSQATLIDTQEQGGRGEKVLQSCAHIVFKVYLLKTFYPMSSSVFVFYSLHVVFYFIVCAQCCLSVSKSSCFNM